MSNRWAWVLLLGIAVFLLYYFFLRTSGGIHWNADFKQTEKQPYDLHYTKTLLSKSMSPEAFIEVGGTLDHYLNLDSAQAVYVAMGHGLKWNAQNEEALTRFVNQGHTVIMSMQYMPSALLHLLTARADTLRREQIVNTLIESEVMMYYYPVKKGGAADSVPCFYSNGHEKTSTAWTYFHRALVSDPAITVYGYIENKANLIEVPYGKGKWILHSNPMVFSNLHMSAPENYAYLRHIFEMAGSYELLYWEFNNILDMENAMLQELGMERSRSTERTRGPTSGPLVVLLSERSFKYAWYLLLSGIVLFMVFAAKRRQRPVPLLQKRENTSLEYIQIIGELYFRHGEQQEIAQLLYKSFCRDFYMMYQQAWDPSNPEQTDLISRKTLQDATIIRESTEFIQQYSEQGILATSRLPELRKHIQTILNQQ